MNILWLGQEECHEVPKVGGKVASLSLLAAEHQVPHGFCMTTEAFNLWGSGTADTETVQAELQDELATAYDELSEHYGEDQPSVAVRSSAIDEDGTAASFAGQYETYLNVSGVESISQAILRCWDSMNTERVKEYRSRNGLSGESQVAVLVQKLIPADVSAVVFSANPVTDNRREVVINASWGLGESIVGGTVTPDIYRVQKEDLAVEQEISEKLLMTVSIPNGTKEVDVPRFLQSQAVLDSEQASEMALLAISLEEKLGWPVDVECAIHEDHIYLLQCRPITTLTNSE